MSERSLEELLFHMPAAAERAPTAWARDFARAMARLGKRRNWRPSRKQRAAMEALVSQMFDERGEEVVE